MKTGVPDVDVVEQPLGLGIVHADAAVRGASSRSSASSGVPWMPTPGAERPIQRVPSGLPGPGGDRLRALRPRRVVGGYHHGFFHLTTILNWPSGVG